MFAIMSTTTDWFAKLKTALDSRGWSQYELSRRLEDLGVPIPQSRLSKWAHGTGLPEPVRDQSAPVKKLEPRNPVKVDTVVFDEADEPKVVNPKAW